MTPYNLSPGTLKQHARLINVCYPTSALSRSCEHQSVDQQFTLSTALPNPRAIQRLELMDKLSSKTSGGAA